MSKTNAMRILDSKKIDYAVLEYNIKDDKIDAISVAEKLDMPLNKIYKTLVTSGSKGVYVFVIPANKELNLKKAAKYSNEKKIELVNTKDIEKLTGYIRGGCSPIGMKRKYPIYIQEDSLKLDKIVISGGRIGSQISIKAQDLLELLDAEAVDVVE